MNDVHPTCNCPQQNLRVYNGSACVNCTLDSHCQQGYKCNLNSFSCALPPPLTLERTFGDFSEPYDVAVDLSGYVYVVDADATCVQKFYSSGEYITTWGSYGDGNYEFYYPQGIATEAMSGDVYVANTHGNEIKKFDSNGVFIRRWGSQGNGDNQFMHPRGVAVDSLRDVYVADTLNCRIQKFTKDGGFITKWGSCGGNPGQFFEPVGVAVDSLGRNVYVVDSPFDRTTYRLQKFTYNGTQYVYNWTIGGSAGWDNYHFNKPKGVAVDSLNNVYVSDENNQRIIKYYPNGTFITKWSTKIGSTSYFPLGIDVASSGAVFVVTQWDKVQKYS